MKLPSPSPNSLFAILIRSPFWVSLAIAVATYAIAQHWLPPLFAAATTVPWLATMGFAIHRQIRTPSAKRVAKTLETLAAMQWPQFSAVISDVFRGEGYTVGEPHMGPVTFALERNGYTTLAGCRRWKVGQTGIPPLRELADAAAARNARDCIYVTTGTFTDNAVAFAREKKIRLLHGAELAQAASPVLPRHRARTPAMAASSSTNRKTTAL